MSENTTNINWYPGHMAKTKRQIVEDLKLIDIVIEMLDARIPKSSINVDMQDIIKNKKRIILLNKADLADTNATKEWIEYYKKNNITAISLISTNNKEIKNVIAAIKKEYKEIEEKYIKKGRINKPIRVMILGIPNVGKSTFINTLSKKSSAKVGNKPGVTKQKQWIKMAENIELMDTPGMLWPKFDNEQIAMHLAFIGTIGSNAIDNEEIVYHLLEYLLKNYPEKIEERYKVETKNKETIDVLEDIAKKRGAIISNGNIDTKKISDIILNEFQNGKLGRITIEFPR